MQITEIMGNREDFWDLLLLADPSERMVRLYLDRGFMLKAEEENGQAAGEVLTVPTAPGEWEIKNLAVREDCQRRGYGSALVDAVKQRLPKGTVLLVGTADSGPGNLRFYESCGFLYFRVEPEFFLKNYPEPVIDNGVRCVDMIYLKQVL